MSLPSGLYSVSTPVLTDQARQGVPLVQFQAQHKHYVWDALGSVDDKNGPG